ncbi:MAG TPA: hypothetical protein VLM83_05515 [Anaerolineales bacterium]|nr:hypothetical protein [Anaerolineales bacterium]
MKHVQILKQSWEILWSYKTLWVFGIILALTTASGGGGGGNGGSGSGSGGSSFLVWPREQIAQTWNDVGHGLTRLVQVSQPGEMEPWLITLIVVGSLIGAMVGVLFTIGHFVSQVALIRMVDRHEETSEKLTWRQGFRLGWSKAAWRLFLISFLIGLAGFLVFTLLFGLAALPAVFGSLAGDTWIVIGSVLTVALAMPVTLLMVSAIVLVSLVLEPVRRICVLEERGVINALRQGWQMVRANLKDIGLMWLIVLGIRLGLGIALIPVAVILGGVALLLGGGLGGLVYLATSTLTGGWVYAAVLGGLAFITILAVPLTFIGGLEKTYLSSTWTLTYRALKPM